MSTATLPVARGIWAAVEPIASSVYFLPEVHRAYNELGFDGPSRVQGGIEFPDMLAYFTSRGACLGPNVSGHLVAVGLRRLQAADGGRRRRPGLGPHRPAGDPRRPPSAAPPRG